MNRNEMEGNWKQLTGRVKEKWGELTEDDIDQIDGRFERLVGKLQERYGKTEQEASKEANDFFDSLKSTVTAGN